MLPLPTNAHSTTFPLKYLAFQHAHDGGDCRAYANYGGFSVYAHAHVPPHGNAGLAQQQLLEREVKYVSGGDGDVRN